MQNQKFELLPSEHRQKKLTAIFRHLAPGALNEEHLRTLCLSLQEEKQYCIITHTNPDEFRSALTLVDGDRGSIVFGQALFGDANRKAVICDTSAPCAAIICRCKHEESRELHLFTPAIKTRKGA